MIIGGIHFRRYLKWTCGLRCAKNCLLWVSYLESYSNEKLLADNWNSLRIFWNVDFQLKTFSILLFIFFFFILFFYILVLIEEMKCIEYECIYSYPRMHKRWPSWENLSDGKKYPPHLMNVQAFNPCNSIFRLFLKLVKAELRDNILNESN